MLIRTTQDVIQLESIKPINVGGETTEVRPFWAGAESDIFFAGLEE
jgi:hypothetical protein